MKLITLPIAALLALPACNHDAGHACSPAALPISGDPYLTGLGVLIYAPAGADAALLCAQVDLALEEWISIWQAREPGWQREVLIARAQLLPAVIYDLAEISGCSGFWMPGSHVGVALHGGHYDYYLGVYLDGVRFLLHEWTHVLKGNFH